MLKVKQNELLSVGEIIKLLTEFLGLNLKPVGKNFFILCPFHKEKTPSFCFNPNYKIFSCFGCNNFNNGKSGNIFVFWSQFKKITLSETFKELSELGFIDKEEIDLYVKKKDFFFDYCSLINDIYNYNVFTNNGRIVLNYLLKKRKLEISTIDHFSLGCTIEKKQLTNLLFQRSEYLQLTQSLHNLWIIDNNNEIIDFFPVFCLIIPLYNEFGQLSSWAARKIVINPVNKYIFLPSDHSLPNKSGFIYNYFENTKLENEECFLVEGFFDVISLTQIGIKNCLSILGTSVSNKQLQLLKNLKKRIILFLDGDEAGRSATIKIIVELVFNKIDCEVVDSSYKKDPDELCQDFKKEEIENIVSKRVNPFIFVIDFFFQQLKIKENPQRSYVFVEKVLNLFEKCKFFHSFIYSEIKKRISPEITNEEFEKNFFYQNFNWLIIHPLVFLFDFLKKKIIFKENEILNLCLRNRGYWVWLANENYCFSTIEGRRKYRKIHMFYNNNFWNSIDEQMLFNSNDILLILQQINNIKIYCQNFYEKI